MTFSTSSAIATTAAHHHHHSPLDTVADDLRLCDGLIASLRDKFKSERRLWFKCMQNNVKPHQGELRELLQTARLERREARRQHRHGQAAVTTVTGAAATAADAITAADNWTFVNRRFAVATFDEDHRRSRSKTTAAAPGTSAQTTPQSSDVTTPWTALVAIFDSVRQNRIIDDVDAEQQQQHNRLLSAEFERRKLERQSLDVDYVPPLVFEDFD